MLKMHLSLAAGCGALALALPALAAEHIHDGRKISAELSGDAEVPGPGDADGSGSFTARINPGQGEICYTLTVDDIAMATAAHIHVGAADAAGPPRVFLAAPAGGSSSGCLSINRNLAMKIIREPENYYVNVHNAEFPPGAVRGQLVKGD